MTASSPVVASHWSHAASAKPFRKSTQLHGFFSTLFWLMCPTSFCGAEVLGVSLDSQFNLKIRLLLSAFRLRTLLFT